MNELERILYKNGPSLSSDLVQELVTQYHLSPQTARKRVSRAGKDIHRLEGLPLPRNVKFLYLKKDYRSPFFWKALYAAFKDTNSAYWHAIAALKERKGVMPYDHFLISCGSPLKQQKHIPPQNIIERLARHGILSVRDLNNLGPCVILTEFDQDLEFHLPEIKARLVCEKLLIKAVSQWAKNLALVSYNIFKDRDSEELPKVSTTLWDMAGPSYVSSLVNVDKNEKIKPGFFACDILLNKRVSEDGIQPFLRKCKTLRGLTKVGRCMQMFVANEYQSEAFKLAREAGIIPATVQSLFGHDIAEGLINLLQTLEHAARAIIIEPERFNQLFDKLGKIEGAVGNLRGALFEYFSAAVVQKTHSVSKIQLNKVCKTSNGREAESDIIAELNNGEVLFIECKGHQPNGNVDKKELDKWYSSRIPTLRQFALEHPEWRNKELRFELWTTGSFSDESLEFLASAKDNTRKYKVNYYDAKSLLEVISKCHDKAILQTYFKCFLDHPLKQLEQDWLENLDNKKQDF